MILALVGILVIVAVVAVVMVILDGNDTQPHSSGRIIEPEERRYGRHGEEIATDAIIEYLREDDALYTNVPVSYGEQRSELDNVIVNRYGVFIIEVKNYKGRLYGDEDDYEWQKCKDDANGNTHRMMVKNPIKQVRRQTYILHKYLESYGVDVWVQGYALLIHGNSPVESPYILSNVGEIDIAIHTRGKNGLDSGTVGKIKELLSAGDG